jgi:hypothetical protein
MGSGDLVSLDTDFRAAFSLNDPIGESPRRSKSAHVGPQGPMSAPMTQRRQYSERPHTSKALVYTA